MKRIKLFFALILVITGCSDSFLDLAPISNSSVQTFYTNEGDFTNAIYGAYSTLRSNGAYSDYYQLVGELRSDNTEMGSTASDRFYFFNLQEFNDQVTNVINENIWNKSYQGILRVNEILDRIDKLTASEAFKGRITGEAKFLRAIFYFNLVRVFGDVPLVTSVLKTIEEAYEAGRTEKSEVYTQIINDLLDAENKLPLQVKGEEGRATKGAASALLGKVYLTIRDFNNAKIKLTDVINSNQYQLLTNYADLWKIANKNHKESIFDVQFKKSAGTGTGSNFCERYTPYLYPYLNYYSTGGGFNIPTVDLIAAYEPNDLRKDASLRESYVDKSGNTVTGLQGRFCIKFFDNPVQSQGSDDNWPVLRYADVLLMCAEALNEIAFEPNGPAFNYLNMIRIRAGLPQKTAGNSNPALAINSQQEFRLAIEQERRVELAFEGHRWFDLVRTGRAIEVLNPKKKTNLQDYHLLLPIPQTQVDINPRGIKQNPGYGV
ncbi:MAG TPA: RagB/SusD family nutrient uptake outer membrane protein [Bacteroidales bacterium]|nr:RagB/SusD family nutrient uptake outer membrane protein [Bacteroidales bacterium]